MLEVNKYMHVGYSNINLIHTEIWRVFFTSELTEKNANSNAEYNLL